ncbi:MAG: hypothetical protein M3Y87_13220 [Myxococcota bacterium]|nr:hypothetical protein [Myxococcota bacterium]
MNARPASLLLALTTSLVFLAACEDVSSPAGPRPPVPAADASVGADGSIVGAPTYHGEVRPILAARCEGCHLPGGIAPFALDTYDIAAGLSMRIAEVTRARTMPPYPVNASGDCHTFDDPRYLDEHEIATLEAWHAAGAPLGDPSTPAPTRMEPPTLAPGEATHAVELEVAYTPERSDDDTPLDEIRCFLVDPGLAAEGFLTGYEVVPGAPSVVHHAILFEPESAAAAADAAALDAEDARAGYDCNGGSRVASHPVVLWAPGGGAQRFPAGTGLRIATHPMVLQIHYNLSAGAVPDRTRVDLVVTAGGVREAQMMSIADPRALLLAPRSTAATAEATVMAPSAGQIWGAFPHMHQRGRTMRITQRRAGAADACMLDVDRWDFDWQLGYYYESPIAVARGDVIHVECSFDTTGETEMVTWGEGTPNEMCITYLYVTGP